jgi:predicted PolB exonuclease-like 3'-5' exonuclease
MAYAVFDIETRVDKALLNQVFYPGEGLGDADAYERFRQDPRNRGGDFAPLTLHAPIAIVIGEVDADYHLRAVEGLGSDDHSEEQLVREFWHREECFDGIFVTFNGRGFDWPVLELMALRYGIAAPRYFGADDSPRLRHGGRHLDLYDWLCNFGAAGLRGGMDLLLKMLGLQGKTTLDGSRVQEFYEAGRLAEIERYCRDDVIQTYLLFLRVELMRGCLDQAGYRAACSSAEAFRAGMTA